MSDAQVDVASELADTLDKTTIGEDVGSIDATTKSANDDVDEVDLAKWVAPKKYDYDSFSSKPDGAAGGDETGLSWASHARRYEWEGDYGEVPPSDPEVEKELFQTELAIREGENFSQLKMEVVQEAPVHVEPIHDASIHLIVLRLPFANLWLVQRRRSSPGYAGHCYSAVQVRVSDTCPIVCDPGCIAGKGGHCLRSDWYVRSRDCTSLAVNLTKYRFGKDSSIPDPHSLQSYGEGKEAVGTPPPSKHLQ